MNSETKKDQETGQSETACLANNACRHPIFDMRVLKHVWMHCEVQSKQNMRLVCKTLKNSIDSFLGMPIIIDEKKLSSLRETVPPSASDLYIRELPDQINLAKLLSQTRNPRSLVLDGTLDSQVFKSLLTKFPTVTTLCCTPFFTCNSLDTYNGTKEKPFQPVPPLVTLKELRFPNQLNPRGEKFFPDIEWANIRDILTKVDMPFLHTIDFKFFFPCQNDFYNCIDILSDFLEKRCWLKNVELVLRLGKVCTHDHEQSAIPKLKFDGLGMSLKHLKTLRMHCHHPFEKILDKMLQQQESLEELEYEQSQATWSLYEHPIKSCSRTIQAVSISYTIPPLNLAFFENCLSLRKLELYNQHLKAELPTLDILQFQKLPVSLSTLRIHNYCTSSESLKTLKRLKKLKFLDLSFLAHPKNNANVSMGLTPEVLKIIFSMRQLETLWIEEFWSSENCLSSLTHVLDRINDIRYGHNSIIKLGVKKYGIAIAPKSILRKWEPQICVYSRERRQ